MARGGGMARFRMVRARSFFPADGSSMVLKPRRIKTGRHRGPKNPERDKYKENFFPAFMLIALCRSRVCALLYRLANRADYFRSRILTSRGEIALNCAGQLKERKEA